MEQSYDLQGIVKFALRREVMAWRTYDRLSEIVEDAPAHQVILQLVGFELDHVRQFTEVLRPQIEAAGVDPDAIVKSAESEPLDMGGYVDEDMLAKASLGQVLGAAIKFEQAMARYYEEAAAHTEDKTVKGVLEELAGQERSHEVFIGDLLGSLELDPGENPEEFPSL